jgi:hypothetical protein
MIMILIIIETQLGAWASSTGSSGTWSTKARSSCILSPTRASRLAAAAVCLYERLDDPEWAVLKPTADQRAAVQAELARLEREEDDAPRCSAVASRS